MNLYDQDLQIIKKNCICDSAMSHFGSMYASYYEVTCPNILNYCSQFVRLWPWEQYQYEAHVLLSFLILTILGLSDMINWLVNFILYYTSLQFIYWSIIYVWFTSGKILVNKMPLIWIHKTHRRSHNSPMSHPTSEYHSLVFPKFDKFA